VALIRAAEAIDKLKLSTDQKAAAEMVKRALYSPSAQIAINAGKDGAVVVDKINNLKGNEGYNAATDTYEDMIKAGILDPTKVVRSALQNAASIAGLMLTTECMVADDPEEKKGSDMPAMPPGGMGGGMGGGMY
jgi:chaperonin GroEL